MSDQVPAGEPAPLPPTTVVGYPAVAGASPPATPGIASLRSAVGTVRVLMIATLALLVILSVGVVLGIASVRSQVDQLSAQVAALESAAPAPQPAAAAPQAAEPEPAAKPPIGSAVALPGEVALPTGVDATGAVLIGNPDAGTVVEVYVDYQCPYCQRWEEEVGAALATRALTAGSDLLIKQYNLAFLGEASPTLDPPGASARAASAAACMLEGEGAAAFAEFNAAVFAAADPAEPASQFSTEVLSALAQDAGAGRRTVTCIQENRHVPFVAVSTQAGFARGVGGTPTVLVNGRTLENPFTDAEITALAAR